MPPHEPNVRNTFNVGVTPAGLAITRDGKLGFVANSNGYGIANTDSVTVLDLCAGVPCQPIYDVSFNEPYTVSIDDCDKYAYVSNSGGSTVTIIDICTKTVSGVISGFDGPSGVALSKTTAYIINYGATGGAGSGNGHTVSVVDLPTKTIVATIDVGQAPAALTLSAKRDYLYVVNYILGYTGLGTMSVVQTSTNTVIATITGFSGPYGIALTRCGHYAYVTNFGSNNFQPFGTTVSVVDLRQFRIIKNINAGIQPSGICISLDGKHVYITNYNTVYAGAGFTNLTAGAGTVNIIRTCDNKTIAPTITVGQSPSAVVISPDGSKLYVSNYVSNTVSVVYLK